MEKINIMGEEDRPLGEIISHKDEDIPSEDHPEIPEMPEEEPEIQEIIPDPPKEKAPPLPPPDKGWLEKLWKRKPKKDKPN